MTDRQRRYKAFLLRLWQERSGGQWIWRASLEDPHSTMRKGFPDLERLFVFLKEQIENGDIEET